MFKLKNFDKKLITRFQQISPSIARAALFIIFFWFGLLKVLGVSSANFLVQELLNVTASGFSFHLFSTIFGWFEVLIGVLFLIPKATRVVLPLLLLHFFVTFLPLILLPKITWQGILIHTITGQYIIKNIALLAVAFGVAAHLPPLKTKKN